MELEGQFCEHLRHLRETTSRGNHICGNQKKKAQRRASLCFSGKNMNYLFATRCNTMFTVGRMNLSPSPLSLPYTRPQSVRSILKLASAVTLASLTETLAGNVMPLVTPFIVKLP